MTLFLINAHRNAALIRAPPPSVCVEIAKMSLRQRRSALKAVKEFDAFPKVADDYQKPTARGGTLSIVSLVLIAILVVSEFFYYRSTELKYEYSVDVDMDAKLRFTLDMTVAMPCQYLGADILDLAGDSRSLSSHMKMEQAYFELTSEQMAFLNAKRTLLAVYSEFRSLVELPVVENILNTAMPPRRANDVIDPNDKPTSCRIHGSIDVKKVAGNFHVTTGKSIPHPQGHAHLNTFIPKDTVNFSHRIDHFSFGVHVPGAINPLDATLKVSEDRYHIFQYYMRVVPTSLNTFDRQLKTNQFSVTERNRSINHHKGSHGMPGVFFKYDIGSMMVEIREVRRPFWQFLIRLSGIIGGIFATSGMLNSLLGSLSDGALNLLFRRKITELDSVKRTRSADSLATSNSTRHMNDGANNKAS